MPDSSLGHSDTSAVNDGSGRFWQLQSIYVERLEDGGLRIWVGGREVFLSSERAASLLDWMERSQAPMFADRLDLLEALPDD